MGAEKWDSIRGSSHMCSAVGNRCDISSRADALSVPASSENSLLLGGCVSCGYNRLGA